MSILTRKMSGFKNILSYFQFHPEPSDHQPALLSFPDAPHPAGLDLDRPDPGLPDHAGPHLSRLQHGLHPGVLTLPGGGAPHRHGSLHGNHLPPQIPSHRHQSEVKRNYALLLYNPGVWQDELFPLSWGTIPWGQRNPIKICLSYSQWLLDQNICIFQTFSFLTITLCSCNW